MSRVMRKPTICTCENIDADQLRGNCEADHVSAFVFASWIVWYLYFLYPKFQASSHLQWLYNPVCVSPGQNPHCWFSHVAAHMIYGELMVISKINSLLSVSRDVRKPDFCICENKDADQLRGNREADQRLCFRHLDSTISLLTKSEISSLYLSSVTAQPSLCRTWSESPKTGFLTSRLRFWCMLKV